MRTTRTTVRFVALVLSGLSTGVLFGTRVGLGPSTRSLSPATYVEVQQATVRNLRPVMSVLLPSAVAANAVVVALAARERRSPIVAVSLGALACQVTALVITAAVELPINARVMTWSPQSPPLDWEAQRDRWASAHTARTASAVTGFGLLSAAALAS